MGDKKVGNRTPKVSIVIPIWNTEKYLEKCLNSLINQTLQDIEIICVNNGSTDSCGKILQDFAKQDDRIKIINIEHGCISNARNTGIKFATAPYITFADSDDWVELDCYELAVKEFENDSDIDMVCWGANIINLNMDENSSYIKGARGYHKIKFHGKNQLNDDIILDSTVCVWNKMFKRDIIIKNEILFPVNIELEDNSFFYTYVVYCKYAFFIDKYLYNYVQHKNSGFEKIQSKQTDIIAPNLKNWIYITQFYKRQNILNKNKSLVKKVFLQRLKSDLNWTLKANYPKVLDKAAELLNILDEKNFMKYMLYQIESKNYDEADKILKGQYIQIFGNKIIGLYLQEICSRYQLKIFGIKLKFRIKGVN